MTKIRSPICWFGGKGQLISKLLKYIPSHTYYCEVFGGGASLLFAKPPAKFEVYNDIDSRLVNFFRVLRDKERFEKFYQKVCLTPYSREEYYHCRETWEQCEDEAERAYRWYIAVRMAFSGDFNAGWSYSFKAICRNMSGAVSRWLSIIELLPEIHQRIMTVQIEHLDWRECVSKYNGWKEQGFFYLDPPYVPETRRGGEYRCEMTVEDHKELINWLLKKCKVKIMLSGYDNELYQKLEVNGWKKICWDVDCNAVGRTRQTGILGEEATHKKNQRRTECIWINYQADFTPLFRK
jgi:DNA adenine methylase